MKHDELRSTYQYSENTQIIVASVDLNLLNHFGGSCPPLKMMTATSAVLKGWLQTSDIFQSKLFQTLAICSRLEAPITVLPCE